MAEYSIGVDLGGTNLRAAAISADGVVLAKTSGSTKLSEGRDAVIGDIVNSIEALKRGRPRDALAGEIGRAHV
jgi:glucokinase